MDLSVVIPARNEMFLKNTVEDCLLHAKGDTEIIVVLDGAWADPALAKHDRVQIIYLPDSIGQRAATNLAARVSKAKYILKADAHCSFDDGFDVKLIEAGETLGRDVTQIPRLYNLRAFTWLCEGCGKETYQGPTPTACLACMAHGTAGGPFKKLIKWDRLAGGMPGKHVRSDYWFFDETLHFGYWSEYGQRPEAQGDIVDVMTNLGALFFLRRERFLELGGLDEAHGSWGNCGVEVACKAWLSGGRHVVNKTTWVAHLFRTQGSDFSFPYALSGGQVDRAKKYSRDLWLNNRFSKQIYPLSWLLEKFAPVKGWSQDALARANVAGDEFYKERLREQIPEDHQQEIQAEPIREHASVGPEEHVRPTPTAAEVGYRPRPTARIGAQDDRAGDGSDGGRSVEPRASQDDAGARDGDGRGLAEGDGIPIRVSSGGGSAGGRTHGVVYYSDCRPDPVILESCRRQLAFAAQGVPVVSCTLKPVDLGLNIVLSLERGYLTMARQILVALELSVADVVFFCEHDVLYDPGHFDFVPEREDTFYYNQNTVKVRAEDGHTLFYLCNQLSGMCAYRTLALKYYRKRVARLEKDGFSRNVGHEPGTRSTRRGGIMDAPYASWMSIRPNVDIRHSANLTKSRWRREEFRDQKYCQGWREGGDGSVVGWPGIVKGRFTEWLREVTTHG